MPNFDQSTVRCQVFAYKEGLLSAVGHDVALSVEQLSVSIEGDKIEATFDPASLRVLHAMKGGSPNPGALSDKDKKTIEGYVREDILHSRRYPKIRFVGRFLLDGSLERQDDELLVEGTLELHGRSRAVKATVRLDREPISVRVKLHQPDFGIQPFKAMLGTLRIQSDVEVELSVPREAVQDLLGG
jgi:hypothetical protein